ncbi:sulfatase [Candidatus Altiarchaeota archaeon]
MHYLRMIICSAIAIIVIVSAGNYLYGPALIDQERAPILRENIKCEGCNILFISIDTLRADHLGLYGYSRDTSPVLDELGRKSMVFTRFYAPIPETIPSHASMFTSRLPHEHKLQFNGQIFPESELTLAEILGDKGYSTAAFTSVFHMSEISGLHQGFKVFDNPEGSFDDLDNELTPREIRKIKYYHHKQMRSEITARVTAILDSSEDPGLGPKVSREQWHLLRKRERKKLRPVKFSSVDEAVRVRTVRNLERTADKTTDLALDWLSENKERPFFMFVHYFDPHEPYLPPSGHDLFADDDHDLVQAKIAGYDGEIRFVDSEVGRLLDFIGKGGLAEDTVIVVTSDHGESLGEHNYFWDHGDLLYEDQLRIPLIIYSKGMSFRDDRLSQNIQLMPTILGIIGNGSGHTTVPSLFSGDTLGTLIFESDRCKEPTVNNNRCYPHLQLSGKMIASRNQGFKYILTPRKNDKVHEELYDLRADPLESSNTIGRERHNDTRDELRAAVDGVKDSVHSRVTQDRIAVAVNPDVLNGLKSLGYIV